MFVSNSAGSTLCNQACPMKLSALSTERTTAVVVAISARAAAAAHTQAGMLAASAQSDR